MAKFGRVEARTLIAAADLSERQYHVMRQSAEGQTNVASNEVGGADDLIGVLQNKPTSGHNATIGFHGQTKAVAGAAVTQGVLVTTNGSGRVVAAGSGDWTVGMALEAAGADGDVIKMMLQAPAVYTTAT